MVPEMSIASGGTDKKAQNSIEKGFMVLEALAEFESPIALKGLAEYTHLPKTTLYRILQTLVSTGYATQDGAQGPYSISPKIGEVGRSRRYSALKEAALPLMDSLYQAFNETVNLGVLVGTNVQYVHVIETTKPLRWIVRPGAYDSFHSTALGRAITAFLPDDKKERLISLVGSEQGGAKAPISSEKLREILKRAREAGWALDDEDNANGVVCFATPLFRRGEPVAAISVSLPKSRLTPDLQARLTAALEDLDTDFSGSLAADRR